MEQNVFNVIVVVLEMVLLKDTGNAMMVETEQAVVIVWRGGWVKGATNQLEVVATTKVVKYLYGWHPSWQ
jgi:hypothetical protein